MGKRIPIMKNEEIKEKLEDTRIEFEIKEFKLTEERRKLLAKESYNGRQQTPKNEVEAWLPQFEPFEDKYHA